MDISYALTPFLAWLVAGVMKFIINSIKARKLAFNLIGYGGLPSNHSAIVTSIAALIAFKEGIDNPAFGVAIALAFIVILDANSLRRQIGKHAVEINKLAAMSKNRQILRERIGHTRVEIAAGILVGIAVAAVIKIAFV
ncbi:divergent PAP2 family protein [Yersinia proxima]|uniref:divergent PAP2 family protein n=1 Tax=Yersinia proxima TaxID=2890316 RepID=UPI000981E649|nr:divergent PAP2 family protein [Yersinia proxima]